MSRPKTPLNQLNASSVVNHPGRIEARLGEYASKPIGKLGPPPRWMTKEEKKIWRTLARSAPLELGVNDRTLMEIVVTLKAKLETHQITTPELGQLTSCLKSLGYIPVDRKAVLPEKAADEFDRFIEEEEA